MKKETTDHPDMVSAQLRSETIAYALQSGVANVVANFFEPYVNYRFQKYLSNHHHPHGNYTQNLAGEFAGDVMGASALIAAEAFCPETLHRYTRKVRQWIDPLYTSIAHVALGSECGKPGYEEKLEKWKAFQERNVVRSAIMMAAGITGNVLTQKCIAGNPSPTRLIFFGKLASSALSTSMGLALRFVWPQQTRGLDKMIGEHIMPWMEDKTLSEEPTPITHAARVTPHHPPMKTH